MPVATPNKNDVEDSEVTLKKKYFIELIRLTSMQPEQLDPILPIMIHQIRGHGRNLEELVSMVKSRIVKDEFIEQFVPSFNEHFSLEEIIQLIFFYRSEVLRKFLRQGMKLYHPFYEAYRQVVKEVVREIDGP